MSDDLLVTLMMNKTRGQLQQHLRLQANLLRTFDQVLVIIKEYYQSRHLQSVRSTRTFLCLKQALQNFPKRIDIVKQVEKE